MSTTLTRLVLSCIRTPGPSSDWLCPVHPTLRVPQVGRKRFRNAQISVFAAFTVNFGPQTVCYPHLDLKNLAYGWCAITALGDYDWHAGSHLVLWDLKLIIEFPPGTSIFIPSALVTHSNTAIAPSERRYSFTMYSAGGLFRWVEHGFISEKVYNSTLNKAEATLAGKERWASGFALFSTLADLKASAQNATL
ncbi:hypothetical protein VNI00_015535 [Paramarasmius palmivorus]|uniref:Prolyl 4-hydroxylase alpha subunit Fe(2+) 2OG dioxygenase domain-containing protein n=1 Tax=Paramarasmius palmivorus TaxID=297713 RepID=A0AAW0BKW3_9AGAR